MIAIDLGSNTIRFLAADCDGKTLWETQFVVRSAENLLQSGVISEAAIERIIAAIAQARGEFDFCGHPIAAVTTEAFRRAKNQTRALERIKAATGIEFAVIGPETEARLTAKASAQAAERMGITGASVVLDIGGASSEAIYIDGEVKALISLPIGIVTVTEQALSKTLLEG